MVYLAHRKIINNDENVKQMSKINKKKIIINWALINLIQKISVYMSESKIRLVHSY